MSKFWEDLPSGYYDHILKKGLSKNRGIQANWHNITFREVRKNINSNQSHLDYACGPGTFIGLYDLPNSIGVDISKNQIDYANNKYSNKGEFKVVNKEELKKLRFDVISIIGLFEFIDENEIKNLLEFLSKILNKNGKILITTPNYGGSMIFLEKLLNFFGPVNYRNQHINRLNRDKILEILKDTDFKKIKIKKFLNVSIFTSIINLNFAIKLDNFIAKIFRNFFGFLLFIELSSE